VIELYIKISAITYCFGLLVWMYKKDGDDKMSLSRYLITNMVASILWPLTLPLAVYLGLKK